MSAGGPNVPVGPGAINPYSPPAASIEAAGLPTVVGYRSAVGLAKAITIIMGLDVIAEVCGDVNAFVTISVMQRTIAEGTSPQAELLGIGLRSGAIGLFSGLLLITAGVLFCFFMPRANRNATSFGSLMTISPGWTVGWWFVPIANLWMPYQAMKEIWQGSHPDPAVPLASVPAPGLMKWWWGLYLVHSFSAWAVVFAGTKTNQAQDLITSSTIHIVTSAFTIAAALLAVATVRAVARRQEERQKRAATAGAAP